MKAMLKEVLEKDNECAKYLDDLQRKGVTYDQIWYEKLYSEVCIPTFIYYYNMLTLIYF